MKRLFALLLAATLLAGCAPSAPARVVVPTSLPALTAQPGAPDAATAAPPLALWAAPDLPEGVRASLKAPAGVNLVSPPESASLRLELSGSGPVVSTWTYALAAPFPTLTDQASLADLKTLWLQGSPIGDEGRSLLLDVNTLAVFTALWGRPSAAVRTADSSALLDQAWSERTTWTLLPFERLEPRWKVIAVDGQNPIHKDFQPAAYPLQVAVHLNGPADMAAQTAALVSTANRDPARLTTVILTGTTSLVRATAGLMEQYGMEYPAQDIGPVLRAADILHISNEVSFAKDCPAPLPHSGLKFCSQERYIQLLDSLHPKLVDLSGDHLNDWGPEALLNTLGLYRQRGWQTIGGGANLDAGRKPALFTHNGNKIAFLACNYKQAGYASATATEPGAVHCDPAWLYPEIASLKSQGYLVIVTLQDEEYMEAVARPKLKSDFNGAAQAGASLVSGTQSHQPQAFDFNNGVFIHYGLGNLFFDQIHSWETTNEGFIDRHVIYDNRVISSEILTTIFVDYARPRWMTPDERRALLQLIFKASGW